MGSAHPVDELLTASQCVVPAHLPPSIVIADQRASNAVLILVQSSERRALRADMAAAPDIGFVRANTLNAAGLQFEFHSAHTLAQGAGTKVGLRAGSIRAHQS